MGLLDKIENKLSGSKTDKAEQKALESETGRTHTSNLTGTSATHNPAGATHTTTGTGVAGGVAGHELHKHQGHNAGNTGIPGNTAAYDSVNASAPGHHNTPHGHTGGITGNPTNTGLTGNTTHVGHTGHPGHTGLTGNSGSTNLAGTHDGFNSSAPSHHGARHAAETGVAGGVAQHELHQHHAGTTGGHHHNTNITGSGAAPGTYQSHAGTGPAPNTIGPHSSDVANVVDPRVQPDPRLQDSRHGYDSAGTGGASNDHHHGYHRHDEPRGLVPSGENHSAIPTAGGVKVGSGGDSFSGPTSTTGHHTGTHNNAHHHTGAERAAEAGTGAAAITGAGSHGHHHNAPHAGNTGATAGTHGVGGPNSGATGAAPGFTTERKLGGAYEAGYRDATAHLQSERQ